MSSPTIDLDMNLDSPSWNDRDSIVADATDSSNQKHGIHLTSLTPNAVGEDLSTTTNDTAGLEMLDSSQESAPAPPEVDVVEEKKSSTGNLDDMMELVESWKEEIYMMSVKNAILLDDLVRVGADI
ncbi:hypothetical protein ACHAWX_007213 [Stephanocyclus meneghinianus]